MKVSRNWLQEYFETSLPSVEEISDALTFHSFEIEEIIDTDLFDVKILPDRAADCLSHRGIAREIGAVLDLAILGDSLRQEIEAFPDSEALKVSIEANMSGVVKCSRYAAALVRGVKIGPSPAWLKEALESVGQRSINNVVDATNYVMLNIGQPLHAFDAARLTQKDGTYAITVREARGNNSDDEKITTLSGEEYSLPEGTLIIVDAYADQPIGIAGVKGGKAAEITVGTTDVIIESANFDATLVRKASQKLKLWTDASQRFQNRPSPELVAYGMRDVLELIQQVAGGELEGVVDVRADAVQTGNQVEVSLEKINGLLGASYTAGDVKNVFDRLGFSYEYQDATSGDSFLVTAPFERRDITIPENLVEEVGRILGYENIAPQMLPAIDVAPDQARYHGIERVKDFLTERGFTEISTQTFAVVGDVVLANPLDKTRPALRAGLAENMREALTRAANVAPRVLGPATEVKLFEIGTIFKKDGEHLALVLGHKQLTGKQISRSHFDEVVSQLEEELIGVFAQKPVVVDSEITEAILTDTNLEIIGAEYEPRKVILGAYKPFSVYPFALRDIAVWTPERTEEDEVANILIAEADSGETGGLLARIDLFDRFSKEVDGKERISYAFRLVFESNERTLSDEDLNPLMERVTAALNAKEGWEVR